jgi:23S rRNA pseudouridine1911/1915/1917 synthase
VIDREINKTQAQGLPSLGFFIGGKMAQPDSPATLEILFEDEHCLVINKPFGLSTQAPRGIDSLELQVRAQLQAHADLATGPGRNVYLGLPHRLDRPVSGAILLAKTKKGARKLSRQFERRRIGKTYWALVEGTVDPAEGAWTDWIQKVPGEARVKVVSADLPAAQQAVLHYRTLGATPHGSWLEIELETGRMHQIRIQAGSRGRPILGDHWYGSHIAFGPQFDDPRRQAIALHARQLKFTQALTQNEITVVAPLGDSWRALGIDETLSSC